MFLGHYLASILLLTTSSNPHQHAARWDTDQCLAQTGNMLLSIAITEAECSLVNADSDGVGLVYDPQNKKLTDKVKTYQKFNIRIMRRDLSNFNLWRTFENKMPSRIVGDFYIYELDKNFETIFFSGTDGQGVSVHRQGAIRAAHRLYKGLYIRYRYPDEYKNPRSADNLALEVLSKTKLIG